MAGEIRAIALCLLLASCAGSGPPGSPGPNPTPTGELPRPPASAPTHPGTLAFSATWEAPLGAALRCGGPGLLSPFACDLPAGATWGVLPLPGNGGVDCIDPEPNVCFQPHDGLLGFSVHNGGMALLSARTLDGTQPMSIEATVDVTNDCSSDVSYMGPVLYGGGADDGDPTGTYAAAYISCAAPSDPVKLWVYRPTYAGPINAVTVPPGVHTVRIDYAPGVSVTYILDGAVQLVETAGMFGNIPMTFPHDPHAALWFGNSRGEVGRFEVYTR